MKSFFIYIFFKENKEKLILYIFPLSQNLDSLFQIEKNGFWKESLFKKIKKKEFFLLQKLIRNEKKKFLRKRTENDLTNLIFHRNVCLY
jgi:hypothetical protein